MHRGFVTFVALTLAVTACARGHRASQAEAVWDSVLVDIHNDNYFAARVHASWAGGLRKPLGTIAGNGGRAKVVIGWEPRALTFEVLLVTDGSAYLSLPVDVSPADSVELRLPANMSTSGFFRRVR